MLITVAHHVFGNIAREQSPTQQGGHQTLGYTRAELSRTDIQAIEAVAQYHDPGDGAAKWQFFRLPSGRFTISRMTPLPGRDEFCRDGLFLAHSLIVTPADLEKLSFAPFDLMQEQHYMSLAQAVAAYGGKEDSDLPVSMLDVQPGWLERACDLARAWPKEELRKLVTLVGPAQTLSAAYQSVMLVGDQQQILEALQVAFVIALPEDRKFCSFDSAADQRHWRGSATFWGLGMTEPPDLVASFTIDARRMHIRMRSNVHSLSRPYYKWIERVVPDHDIADILASQERMRALEQLLVDAVQPGPPLREDDLIAGFAESNKELIHDRINARIPVPLSPDMQSAFLERVGASPLQWLRWLQSGADDITMLDMIYQVLIARFERPLLAVDRNNLSLIAEKHYGIGLILAIWAQDEQHRQHILMSMTDNQYRGYIIALSKAKSFSAWQVFSPNHLDAWFSFCGSALEPAEKLIFGMGLVARRRWHGADEKSEADVIQLSDEQRSSLSTWLQETLPYLMDLERSLTQPTVARKSFMYRLKRSVFGERQ